MVTKRTKGVGLCTFAEDVATKTYVLDTSTIPSVELSAQCCARSTTPGRAISMFRVATVGAITKANLHAPCFELPTVTCELLNRYIPPAASAPLN